MKLHIRKHKYGFNYTPLMVAKEVLGSCTLAFTTTTLNVSWLLAWVNAFLREQLQFNFTEHTHTHKQYSYMTLIGVHEMHGRVHPNECHVTDLLAVDLCSSLAYFMTTHPLLVASKLPIKALVAKQLQTHTHACTHTRARAHTHTHIHTRTHTHLTHFYSMSLRLS